MRKNLQFRSLFGTQQLLKRFESLLSDKFNNHTNYRRQKTKANGGNMDRVLKQTLYTMSTYSVSRLRLFHNEAKGVFMQRESIVLFCTI